MSLTGWKRIIEKQGDGLKPGEGVRAALLLMPRGTMNKTLVSQAVDIPFSIAGVGGAIYGGLKGGTEALAESALDKRRRRGAVKVGPPSPFPEGRFVVAITDRRFVIYRDIRRLTTVKVEAIASLPLEAVSQMSITRKMLAPRLNVTFSNTTTMTYDVGRGQDNPADFLTAFLNVKGN